MITAGMYWLRYKGRQRCSLEVGQQMTGQAFRCGMFLCVCMCAWRGAGQLLSAERHTLASFLFTLLSGSQPPQFWLDLTYCLCSYQTTTYKPNDGLKPNNVQEHRTTNGGVKHLTGTGEKVSFVLPYFFLGSKSQTQ